LSNGGKGHWRSFLMEHPKRGRSEGGKILQRRSTRRVSEKTSSRPFSGKMERDPAIYHSEAVTWVRKNSGLSLD